MSARPHRLDKLRVFAVLFVAVCIFYFYINLFFPSILPFFLKFGVIDRPLNILVMGTDITFNDITKKANVEIGRSDTLMLMHYDPFSSSLNIVSIPRDSYVDIPGYGAQKINAAYVFGGAELTKKTVENLTGVIIDKYLIINTNGIVKLVDVLGGITVDVEKDLYYTDRAAKLFINLKKGRQNLNGEQAESFIRFRHDATGDLGRIARQQDFLKALAQKTVNPAAFLKIPFIFEIIIHNIKTDMPIGEFIQFANSIRMAPQIKIHTETLPSDPVNNLAGSVLMLKQEELKKIISQYF